MMIKGNLQRLYKTEDLDKKQKVETILHENQIQYVTIMDDMFWANFMGEQRFAANRKAPQSYSVYVYKTYRNEALLKAKKLIADM
ncbi:MAG: hypothetical protein LKF53_00095 [Solobacterium sp.]|nr:hypothetical protein [Solobacterium sp.]MCH4204776.1 hypothetical protein [Solobacterium sp.]MCH4226400.1 hypothetical protein [Solobacterium sp.]MCH4282390.1 hypothetical protein [Solobacterium sp.]